MSPTCMPISPTQHHSTAPYTLPYHAANNKQQLQYQHQPPLGAF